MIDNLTEAIAHAKEAAKENREMAKKFAYGQNNREACLDCAAEHDQLASWLEELKERREADKWISVKDKLPDKAKKYLVQTEYDVVTFAFFEGDYFEHLNGGKLCVKYWRPLPESYKESEAENETDN